MFYARSPRKIKDRVIEAQSYQEHIQGVLLRLQEYVKDVSRYSAYGNILEAICLRAGLYHDLGKLDIENQRVLSGMRKRKSLPVPHWDAGVAYLGITKVINYFSSFLIYGHHKGMKNIIDERTKGINCFREAYKREYSDQYLKQYITNHDQSLADNAPLRPILKRIDKETDFSQPNYGVFLRLAMSCLVDADHTDSAAHCGEFYERTPIYLRPEERLIALKAYVENIEKNTDKSVLSGKEIERNAIRHEMFVESIEAETERKIHSCESPVGTGKTTAIMAYLLKVAQTKNLRRIFVILPFTNIIDQSVEIYRKALVLEGEDPEEVVAALHHRSEYENEESRQYSSLWNAPIIVTTAVQFFETMAASSTAALRKLHNLPGSAIFVDESHAALPSKLWPQGWSWLKIFTEEWDCRVVLASGSLTRFWQFKEFDDTRNPVAELLPEKLRNRLMDKETERVRFKYEDTKMNEETLCEWITRLPGPRLLIVNTVQSAAVIAAFIAKQFGENFVEHISTALTPLDRKRTLAKVKKRLRDYEGNNWTLVATSCVEAGVDFSFRTGIREIASLVSLLQIAGRVRRNNEDLFEDSTVWSIRLDYSGLLKKHPAFEDSSDVLLDFLINGRQISPSLCTEAFRKEMLKSSAFNESIKNAESICNFEEVGEKFKVIQSDTVTVLIGDNLVERIKKSEVVDWKTIQNASVQIWSNKIKGLDLEEIRPNMYAWKYDYNDFIGYMSGILSIERFKRDGVAIL